VGTDDLTDARFVARRLRDLVEPICANVYFAPQVHTRYDALGLGRGPGYFASRGACIGGGHANVPGQVVAAAFGVFKPAVVIAAVDEAWSLTDAATVLAAREAGAVESLSLLLGDIDPASIAAAATILRRIGAAGTVEGRALFAGLQSLGFPGTPIGDLWRACDLVREHRGDSHIIAWTAHGVSAIEATILTEGWWRLPFGSYVATRGWSHDEIDAAIESMAERRLIDRAANELLDAGTELRATIEDTTDRLERPIIDALGAEAAELFAALEPMTDAVIAAKGYPRDPRLISRY
jgi:hypothetical protein